MENHIDPNYGNGNRAFLQAIMARGAITFEESRPILAAIHNADGRDEIRPDQVTEQQFQKYITAASEAASLFDYEIRSVLHQVTRQRVYSMANTTSDPQTQLATVYNPEELAFIKRVFDAMFDKFNTPRMEVMAITQMQAIKFARPDRRESTQVEVVEGQPQTPMDKGLKHSEVETVLANLVDGGWLEKSRAGFYSATPRMILELRPWLTETYNEPDLGPNDWQRIKFCEACKDIVTVGLRCAERDCNLRLHDICQDAYWRAQRNNACPKCSREWSASHYVGERAVTMTDAYKRGKGRSTGRPSTLADDVMQREGVGEEAEEAEAGQDEEGEEEDEHEDETQT
jgi:hypothetical protein